MKRFLIVLFWLPLLSKAQFTETGLGIYQIGITTFRSLNPTDFLEEDQPRVAGTLALSCPHIRKFTAAQLTVNDTLLTNLSMFFYDDTLVRISCDYSDIIRFRSNQGNGVTLPERRIQRCLQNSHLFQSISGMVWQSTAITTMIVYSKGYDEHCQQANVARLTIFHKGRAALSSECDLEPNYPFLEVVERNLRQ